MTRMITEKKYDILIPDGKKKERIDTYLANTIEYATRSRIQQLIKANLVTVNDKIVKANQIIGPGDYILVRIPCSPRPENIEAEDIPVHIVYEDDYLLIVNKPKGMVVHPSLGNHSGTLVNALLFYTKNLSLYNDAFRPGIVHRIDKDTSGLLVVAKDEWTHAELSKQFKAHDLDREYWALCWGKFEEKQGEILGNIGRSKKDRKLFTVTEDEGKHAHTFFEVLEEFEYLTLVKLKLKTGRTHQIRVHMAHINRPIFGDPTYGGRKIAYTPPNCPKQKAQVENLLELIDRQALHAKTLGFYHPRLNKKVYFDSPLPNDFETVLNKLRGKEDSIHLLP